MDAEEKRTKIALAVKALKANSTALLVLRAEQMKIERELALLRELTENEAHENPLLSPTATPRYPAD